MKLNALLGFTGPCCTWGGSDELGGEWESHRGPPGADAGIGAYSGPGPYIGGAKPP